MAYEPTTPSGKACQLLAQHASQRNSVEMLSFAMVERVVADCLGSVMDLEPHLRKQEMEQSREWLLHPKFEVYCYGCDLEPSWVRAVVRRFEQ